MIATKEIKKIITDNKNDIAFVVGNGIHRHNNDDALSWDKLLIELWGIASGETKSITDEKGEIIKGISYTEFYDVLEMKCAQVSKERIEKQRVSLSKLLESVSDMDFDTSLLRDIPERKPFTEAELIKFSNQLAEYKLNDFEWDEILNAIEKQNAIHGLQLYISNLLSKWKANDCQARIASFLHNLNVPVLTTNYDRVLADAVGVELKKIKEKRFTHYYPWSSYYAQEKLNHPLGGFGIWHINGMVRYSTSIRLGLSQYMGSITRARKFIHQKSEELFTGKNQEHWGGKDTWLHIIFNRSLFIFGLALEENETFLRWLLIQRANYFNKFPERAYEGWYLCRKEDIDKSPGKRFFLESVGIKILEVENYKIIYEDIWQ